jgi:glycosyltransferase involved in cell wall biosynthesis
LFHIEASKKVVWIHGALRGGKNPDEEYVGWLERFDKVFCVSQAVKKDFERCVPKAAERTELFYNLIDSDEIREKAGSEHVRNEAIVLTTVGRLGKEKGQVMIPQVARYLLDAGYAIKWYVVGDGAMKTALEKKCKEFNVTEHVILEGTQSNPYPYIKNCDIYVQTSYSEGWCLTTQEAKILHKPIVTTDLPVMREQFLHMKNGLITTGISPEALFEGIKILIDDSSLRRKFVEELKKEAHDNTQELEKLYAFIES